MSFCASEERNLLHRFQAFHFVMEMLVDLLSDNDLDMRELLQELVLSELLLDVENIFIYLSLDSFKLFTSFKPSGIRFLGGLEIFPLLFFHEVLQVF